MAFTYILKSLKDNSFYVGSTRDLDGRIKKHNKGQVKSTRNRRPFQLVYFEEMDTYSAAYNREKQIKSWKKRSLIEKLINGPVV